MLSKLQELALRRIIRDKMSDVFEARQTIDPSQIYDKAATLIRSGLTLEELIPHIEEHMASGTGGDMQLNNDAVVDMWYMAFKDAGMNVPPWVWERVNYR